MNLESVLTVKNLPPTEKRMLADLLTVWEHKLQNNKKRVDYYEGKNKLKDLGIAIPQNMRNLNAVVGWPAKAVDGLAVRSRFNGCVFSDGKDHGITEILDANMFKNIYFQAVVSELINSVAFLTVSHGDVDEPKAIINAYSALNAAALWDDRKKRIACGLTVIDCDSNVTTGEIIPVWVNLYTNTDIWEIRRKNAQSPWVAQNYPHKMGRPLIEPLVYRPSLDRPFGKSRINKAVMSYTDRAVRTAVRGEISSELFSAPQKYILGANDSLFEDKTRWEAYYGSIFALSKDADGDVPQFGQLNAASMSPHIEYMRHLAQLFSGETSISLSELGFANDSNPTSQEAIIAEREPLIIEAESLNDTNGYALRNVCLMAIATSQDKALSDLTPEEKSLTVRFKDPAYPAIVSETDAVTKLCSVFDWMKDSEVLIERLGFSEDELTRLMIDKDRAQGKQMLETIAAAVKTTPPQAVVSESNG